MSQVSSGATRALAGRIQARRPDSGITVYYWVETLIFGNAVERFLKPERLIVGAADPARPLPAALDEGLRRFGCPILPMGYESAELTKTAINLVASIKTRHGTPAARLRFEKNTFREGDVPASKYSANVPVECL
jgi:UDPglucose 6-dehydrogenase